MAEDKPCISELYESGGLDMELVGKIAHNELDKRKTLLPNSDHALASEYIDAYIDVNYSEIIERYTEVLDTELSVEDFRNGEISPEFVLGLAIARGAESHASADIEYFSDEFSSRAVIEIEELGLPSLRRICRTADDFSLAGVNPEKKFPIGFVSVKDVADMYNELWNGRIKETLKPADFERIASNLADSEQCIKRHGLVDGILSNIELELWRTNLRQDVQGLDDICDAKSEEAELAADDSAVEYGAASNEQSK